MICDECETVKHCLEHGCVPKQPAPVQPVVFYRCNGCGHAYEQVHPTSCDCMEAGGFDRVEYYTTPPAQEIVCSTGLCHYRKPLTDEEIKQLADKHLDVGDGERGTHYVFGEIEFTRAIEAKLRSKNT